MRKKPVDSVGDESGVVDDVRADDQIRAVSIPPAHSPACEFATCLD